MKKSCKKILSFILSTMFLSVIIPAFPAGAASTLASLKNTPPTISADGTYLIMPSMDGAEIRLYGSSNPQVVSLDGRIHKPLIDTAVKLMYKAVFSDGTETPGDYNVSVTIKGEYEKNTGNKVPDVLPAIREWVGGEGYFNLSDKSSIIYDNSNADSKRRAEILREYFEDMLDIELSLSTGTPVEGDIVLKDDQSLEYLGSEGYIMVVDQYITISSSGATGLLYGGISILQSLISGDMKVPIGRAHDYPAYEIRTGMIDVGRAWIPMDYLEEMSRYMAYYKMNEVHLHINDTGANGYSAFRLESDIEGLTAKDGYYTKDEYRQYQKDMLEIGLAVVTEIDTPAHSTCFKGTGVPMLNDWNLDITKPETVEFIKNLFDEYLTGDDPVFINDVVHIGTDEYPETYKEQMRTYINELLEHVKSRGYTPRFWGAFSKDGRGFDGSTPVTTEGAQAIYWTTAYSDHETLYSMGYDIINMTQMVLYTVPGGNYGFADFIDIKNVYDMWQGHYMDMTGTMQVPEGHPQTKGISFALWNDIHTEYLGYTRYEIFLRLKNAIMAICEKGWCGTQTEEIGSDDYLRRIDILGKKAPLSNPLCVVDEDVEFGYNPDSGYKSIGYPYTIDFDVKVDDFGSGGTLFESESGKLYYDSTGRIYFNREVYDFKFDYTLKKGETVHLTYSSTIRESILIVDNKYYYSPINNKTTKTEKTTTAMIFPLETVGENVTNIIIDPVAIDLNSKKLIQNYALGSTVSVSSLEVDDGRFGADCAVDGIISSLSRLSFSRHQDEQWLIVDMGETRRFNQINIHFFEHIPEYKIFISDTGEDGSWEEIYHLTDGVTQQQITDNIKFDTVEARYIKYMQLKRYKHSDYNVEYSGAIMEFEVFLIETEKYTNALDTATELIRQNSGLDQSKLNSAITRLENYMKNLDLAILPHIEALYDDLETAKTEFLKQNENTSSESPDNSEISGSGTTDNEKPDRKWIIYTAAGAVVVAAGVIGFIFLKRKKDKKN